MIQDYLDSETIANKEKYKKYFSSAEPFEHIVIQPFFKEKKLEELKKELQNQDFYLEDHDLYQFLRTSDFKNINSKIITEFREFIFSKEFISFISYITSESLTQTTGSLHSLSLTSTHYLLPHDDQVEKRKIAFILYLCEDFKQEDGGTLDLFETKNEEPTKINKSLLPKKNQFVCFKVSPNSYHQISEVETNKQRLSISGWFY